MSTARLPGAALDAILENLLTQHPRDCVMAVGLTGIRLPMPPSVPLEGQRIMDLPKTALELVVPQDVRSVIDAWHLALRTGVGSARIRVADRPADWTMLQFVDATTRHGVFIVLIERTSDRLCGGLDTPLSRPRVATMRKDQTSVILGIDEAVSQILGWRTDEIVNKRSLEFIDPADHSSAIASWLDMLAVPGSTRRVRLRHRHRDGSWVWFEISNHNRLDDPQHGDVLTEMVNISEEMAANEELRGSEYLLRRVTEAIPLGIFQVDERMAPVYANAQLPAVIGGAITTVFDAPLIAGTNGGAHGQGGEPLTVRDALAQVLVHGGDRDAEILLRPADEQERHCLITMRGLVDEQGAVTGAIACIDDITARRQMEAELARSRETAARQRSEARFRSLVQHASDLITVVTPHGVVGYQSPSIGSLFGYDQDDARATDLLALAHSSDRQRLKTILLEAGCHAGTSTRFEWALRHANGSWRHVETTLTNLLDDFNVQGLVMNTRDITEQKLLEDQLSHQAFHDSLTGLANRALFNNRVEHALQMRDRGGRCTVMMLDLDDFKRVNDSMGHLAGDEVLIEVAQSIAGGLRPFDTAARFGGDEFAILLAGIDRSDQAIEIANRLLEGLSTPIVVQGRAITIRASIGIAHSADGIAPQDLLRGADTALYAAKAQGKNRCRIYNDEMARVAVERLEIENDLRHALRDDQLRVFYQPIVSLLDERVCELEALVRWQHPRRGLLTPAQFIGIAEESGLIVRLGRHVLQTACRDVGVWQRDYPGLVVSVNLSARQFQHAGLIEDVEDALREAGIPPCTLRLEVTESLAMHDARETIRILSHLKRLGVLLAIDDFGTGYSSLAYLKDFTVDTLKIDQSFVRDLANDARNDVIVESIVTLALNLGLSVTAEGIECAEDGARLAALGCHLGQGYLYAKPLGTTELTIYLADAATRGLRLTG